MDFEYFKRYADSLDRAAEALDAEVNKGEEDEIRDLAMVPKKCEHRQNYTGGGGYFLGENRYDGWRIKKYDLKGSWSEVMQIEGEKIEKLEKESDSN